MRQQQDWLGTQNLGRRGESDCTRVGRPGPVLCSKLNLVHEGGLEKRGPFGSARAGLLPALCASKRCARQPVRLSVRLTVVSPRCQNQEIFYANVNRSMHLGCC